MRRFDSLRMHSNWKPRFIHVNSALEAADCINWIHGDYPRYVESTERHINWGVRLAGTALTVENMKIIHRRIFGGNNAFQPGVFRRTNVIVGDHRPPDFDLVAQYMKELGHTTIINIRDLFDWYFDFETVHPFIDGNGRVGGTMVAIYSKALIGEYLVPDEGWHGEKYA